MQLINRYIATLMLLASGLQLSCSSVAGQNRAADATGPANAAMSDGSFSNPLLHNGADPWLEYFDGNYYLTTTTWTSELVMRKSPTLAGLASATPVNVWSATDPARCCNFWAFEFHRLKGPNGYRWYLMYTAGRDGTLDYQHLNVLESAGDDPMGPYQYKGAPMPNVWNIDGNYLEHNGKLYLLYSQWQGDEQLNLIAELENPWTLKAGTPHTVLTRPELDWETSGRKVTEGAEILKHNGRVFMSYSASFCETPDYKLGLLELTGDDPLNVAHWKKSPQPVFSRTEQVFGPGHNGFFTSPDGKEQWLVYHGNDNASDGCSAKRSLRAQKFSFNAAGQPEFGTPLAPGVVVAAPSGEDGPRTGRVQGAVIQLQQLVADGAASNADSASRNSKARCLQADAAGQVSLGACDQPNSQWQSDAMAGDTVRLLQFAQGKALTATADGSSIAPWQNNASQQWQWQHSGAGLQLINLASKQALQCDGGDCGPWQLVPQGPVVLLSQQSGKAVSVADCASTAGSTVQQHAWQAKPCQQWQAKVAAPGQLQLSALHAPQLCLAVRDDAVVPGAALIQASCDAKTAQWQLQPVAGGGMLLRNSYSKLWLDLPSCGLADATALAQAPASGNACQVFHLRTAQ